MPSAGEDARHISSTWVPGKPRAMCLFESDPLDPATCDASRDLYHEVVSREGIATPIAIPA